MSEECWGVLWSEVLGSIGGFWRLGCGVSGAEAGGTELLVAVMSWMYVSFWDICAGCQDK